MNFNVHTGVEIDDAGEQADSARELLEARLAAALHRFNPQIPHHDVAS